MLKSESLNSESTASGEKTGGLWSKLKSPGRFLLPRTDLDEDSAMSLESWQALDDGF